MDTIFIYCISKKMRGGTKDRYVELPSYYAKEDIIDYIDNRFPGGYEYGAEISWTIVDDEQEKIKAIEFLKAEMIEDIKRLEKRIETIKQRLSELK